MWRRVWLYERTLRRGKRYAVRWYGEDGRIRTRAAGTDRRIAEGMRRRVEADLNSGDVGEERSICLGEFGAEHLRLIEGQVTPATVKEHGLTLRDFSGFIGNPRLESIAPHRVEAWFAEKLRTGKPATANKKLRTLHAMFQRAIQRNYLRVNPCRGVKPVREAEKELRVLTREEIFRLMAACPSLRWRALVFVALTTGMRLGELTSLEWRDMDLDGGIVYVRCKESHRTKSGRNRVLALLPATVALLRDLRASSCGEWVFETSGAGPIRWNQQRDFGQIVKRAGIRRCTMHDLRRTFVSHLAMAGVNEAVVQKLAGHSSISTTLKHYTAILPAALASAPKALPYADGVIISQSYHGPSEGVEAKTA